MPAVTSEDLSFCVGHGVLADSDVQILLLAVMLDSKRYLYVVFMCHLAIEKTLKALMAETEPEPPPRTHDLLHLLRRLDFRPPEEHLDFVSAINQASVPTRYPEDLAAMVRQYPKRVVSSYLSKTKRLLKWLRKDPRLAQK